MTQKELLYVEDAIGHEQNVKSIICESLKLLEDDSLVTFLNKEYKKNDSMEKRLVNLLEENSNE